MSSPAYTRLNVDERRRQLLDAGRTLFAEHAYEEISMRQIAEAAGISKPLLYHYFPNKAELFKAAVADQAAELEQLIEPVGDGPPVQQLNESLDGYLAWIEANARAWQKLMQSAATLPEAGTLVEQFRNRTLQQITARITTGEPRPRSATRSAAGLATSTRQSLTGSPTADSAANSYEPCSSPVSVPLYLLPSKPTPR